jgi:flagellar biogenesis protein FliO
MGRGSITRGATLLVATVLLCCLARPAVVSAADAPAAPAVAAPGETPAVAKSEIEREPIRRNTTVASTAPTAATTQRAGAKPGASGNGGLDVRRVTLALGGVVALILLLKLGLKRVFGVASAPRSSRAVQVLTRSPLSPRHQLMVLRVGRRLLVVADGGGQMNTLSEITDPDEVAALLGQLQDDHGGAKFGSVFGKMRRPYESESDADGEAEPQSSTSIHPFDPGAGDNEGQRGDRSERNDPAVTTTRQEVLGLMDKVRMLSRQFKS